MRKKTGNKDLAILQAATKVFANEGYHSAQIAKIAEYANVAVGSVYLYYESKEQILITLFERTWEELYKKLIIITNDKKITPTKKFNMMLDMIFDVFESNPELALVVANDQDQVIRQTRLKFVSYYVKFMDLGEQIVKEGIRKNEFKKNYDIKVLRSVVFGLIRHMLREWAERKGTVKLSYMKKHMLTIIEKGILV